MARKPILARIWRKACRFNISKRKLSRRNLERLCRETATDQQTLVVHSEDFDFRPFFPNYELVSKRDGQEAELHTDSDFSALASIESESYELILCTGLLEHLSDPFRFEKEVYRILKPGGRIIISASCVFSLHEGPDDFYHYTPWSLKLLFKDWSRFDLLRGSSQPFETTGILIQRALFQCDIFPLARPFIELAARVMRLWDFFIIRQHTHIVQRDKEHEIDTMMPSNLQAVIVK